MVLWAILGIGNDFYFSLTIVEIAEPTLFYIYISKAQGFKFLDIFADIVIFCFFFFF